MSTKYQIKSIEGNGFWLAKASGDLCWTDADQADTFESAEDAEAFADSDRGPIGAYAIVAAEV